MPSQIDWKLHRSSRHTGFEPDRFRREPNMMQRARSAFAQVNAVPATRKWTEEQDVKRNRYKMTEERRRSGKMMMAAAGKD